MKKNLKVENEVISVNVDLTRGGAINAIILKDRWNNRSIVNIADEGRYIQQSYYSGNNLDRTAEGQSKDWSPWSWNPIQVGDSYGNRAEILEYTSKKNSIYVKCIPMLWDMKNELAEAVMEQWMEIDKNIIKVTSRLTSNRSDVIYGEGIIKAQELPAVYPVSALNRLVSYRGSKPFSGDLLEELEVIKLSSGFWGCYTEEITENWMAFVDDQNYGIAVYNRATSSFLAGMAGKPGEWCDGSSTSYISPVKKEIINKDTVYEYNYYLIVGELDKIRKDIYEIEKVLKE
ncbi:MAG: hypothetical protein OCD02_07240 [Spirochaetaceae bacterium]